MYQQFVLIIYHSHCSFGLSNITLNSSEGTTSGVRVPRSALFIPRLESATGTITFDFSVAGDKVKVIFLGKT